MLTSKHDLDGRPEPSPILCALPKKGLGVFETTDDPVQSSPVNPFRFILAHQLEYQEAIVPNVGAFTLEMLHLDHKLDYISNDLCGCDDDGRDGYSFADARHVCNLR
jgi:hypothetical protein